MLSELLWTFTMTAAFAQPGGDIDERYDSPDYDLVAPVIRQFEQRDLDDSRRARYESFDAHLDKLWRQYRTAGSTAEARQAYVKAVQQARRIYVERDPLYVPVKRCTER